MFKFTSWTIGILVLIYAVCGNCPVISASSHLDLVIVASSPPNQPTEAEILDDIVSGGVKLLSEFLQQGGSPNRFFHAAVNAGAIDAVKLMLDRGAKVDLVDGDSLTPLMVAARHTYRVGPEMIRLLLDRGAKVNARANKGSTPLMFAAACPAKHYEASYVQVVELLIKRGAKVNVKNNQGLTPLKIAKNGRWHQIIAVLKKAGARG
jgi:uncharacterized protein